ncbi:MAG: hypothetical protein G01um101456_351, partial [Parcubacteria group bacterium Gr01-1014_56]
MKKLLTLPLLTLVILAAALPGAVARAAISEPGFEVEVVASGLTLPTVMAFSPDGRIFVAEKGGTVKVVKNGVLLSTPVITLTDVNTFGDRGLIGMAIDPDFATNGYLYLSYTFENSPGSNFGGAKVGRIVRVTVVADTASESSKVVVLGTVGGTPALPSCEDYPAGSDCIPSDSMSHSVGGLRFGPDGKLYATLGDGANFDTVDPRALRAQNLDSLAGKVIRITTDGTAPSDNPFYNGDPNANRSKVFALGVRNAFRFNFSPTSGALFLGDVGWSTWEEVNIITPGNNYGWPCHEGMGTTTYNCTASSGAQDPAYTYVHDVNGAGAITAGSFPSNSVYPAQYDNSWFFGDYAQNWIKRLVIDGSNNVVSVENFMDNPDGPVDISTGPDGNIYFISIYTGNLNRLTHTMGNRRPVPVVSANPTSGLAPLTVNFSSAGSGDPDGDPVSFSWNFGDGATSTQTQPVHTYTTNGTYTAALTVTDSQGSSASKSIAITIGNQKPSPQIISPASGTLYIANQTIQLNGTATDPEDGTLGASAFHWEIILHHNIHTHTIQQFDGVINPSFTAPDHGATDVYTEVILTVTDSGGLSESRSINLYLDNGAGSGNLIGNPSLEVEDALPGRPFQWFQGWFGNLNPIFTYPVTGLEGARAAKVEITSYTDGNAKWYFAPVFVTPLQEYVFSNYYTANATTSQFAQFGFPDGTYQYQDLGTISPAATSTYIEKHIVMPAGVQTFTVFHEISQVGILTVDNFSLTLASPIVANNLVLNSTLEIQNGINPQGWRAGTWGNHTAVHTYPVTGYNGQKAARVEITSYPANGTGDAKWYFDQVPVTPGTAYTYKDQYRSNTISDIIGRYTLGGGGFHYFGLAKEIQPTTGWQTSSATFTPPTEATHVTFFHLISAVGFVEIDDVELYESGTSTPSETNVPIVEFTNPLEGQTVGGIVTITASSTDDTAVTYIFYAVDGTPVTGQITQPPYAFAWDSASVSNGQHTLKATTHDPSGNNSTHTITVIVDNTTPPVGNNLILNPSLEVAGTGGDPANWFRGGWGTNNRVLTYPVTGTEGSKAAKVEITTYSNGDAKWYFSDVPVTASSTYTYTESYRSNVATNLTARYTYTNGTIQYAGIANLPASSTWANTTKILTTPAGVVSMTVFHSLISIGWLEVDNYSLTSATSTTSDTIAPTVLVTSPTASSTVATSTTVSVTATDNVGVVGVTLLVDGVAVLTEDTTLPYSFAWDTTTVTNGSHTISALARDQAGNTATSSVVSVEVSNTVTVSSNLIANPSLETVGTTGDPENWFRGGWGTNTRVFTYPTAGTAGARAAKVEITSYTNGDAKWFFANVPVTSGATYTLTHKYRANVTTNLTVRYTKGDGSVLYVGIGNPSATTTWTTHTESLVIPTSVVSMTLFHNVVSVGWLEVDDFSLTTGIVGTFTKGMISLTFDDGWYSHYTQAFPILNAANKKGVFYIVSSETLQADPQEQIMNPSLETVGTTGDPENWFRGGWGTNTRVFTYPVAGTQGASAAKVEVTSYTDGDAKWFFADVPILPNRKYVISDSYTATANSQVVLRYSMGDGTVQYVFLGIVPSTGSTWQQFNRTITTPANAASVTLFHVLAE